MQHGCVTGKNDDAEITCKALHAEPESVNNIQAGVATRDALHSISPSREDLGNIPQPGIHNNAELCRVTTPALNPAADGSCAAQFDESEQHLSGIFSASVTNDQLSAGPSGLEVCVNSVHIDSNERMPLDSDSLDHIKGYNVPNVNVSLIPHGYDPNHPMLNVLDNSKQPCRVSPPAGLIGHPDHYDSSGSQPVGSVGNIPHHVSPQVLSPNVLPATNTHKVPYQDPLERQATIISSVWPNMTPQAKELFPDFCTTYHQIKSTCQPNYVKAKCEVRSGLNLDQWDHDLQDYHDKEICGFLRYGWPLGYHSSDPPASVDENHPSAKQYLPEVRKFITTEKQFGAILGPFPDPPFHPWTRCSPVMTRPKKDTLDRRVIVDLTYPQGYGVNAGINVEDYFGKNITYSLPTLGDLVSRLQVCGKGALVWKADLARAYRQLRVDPVDTPLLGIKVDGCYYIDLCPPFGCKTSSAACQRMSNAVVYLMRNMGYFVLAYLDDYGGCEKDLQVASHAYTSFNNLAQRLGLDLAKHKCVPPTTEMEWLGYRINTTAMTIAIPEAKLTEVLNECKKWLGRAKASKKMVQSLVGRLLYLTNCVIAARKFVTRVLATLRAMDDNTWITVSHEFKLDILWFFNYASAANGIRYYTPTRPEVVIQCDSSLIAGGGVANQFCYSWKYPKDHLEKYSSIHHLEAINLMIAYFTLAPLVATVPGVSVIIFTDNMGSSLALQTGRTKDPVFAKCARELWLLAATNNQIITIKHKHGYLIPLADALSRQYHDRSKATFVTDTVLANNLCVVPPRLKGFKFFTDDL